MPIAEINSLNKQSAEAQVKAAISACIAQEVGAGREQEQAVAMCHEMARGKTGGSPAKPEGGE